MGERDLNKEDIVKRFDALAPRRQYWREKSRYYYEDQEKFFRFLVPEGLSVLDLGSASGDLLHALKPRRGVGLDISPQMVKSAKERHPDLDFREADVEKLDPWGETFDVLIMADVIGHLHDIEETIRGFHPFCRHDTRLIVSYYSFLWEPMLKLGELLGLKTPQQHQNWLSSEDIENLLTLAHFQVIRTDCRFLIPKKIPLLSEFVNRTVSTLPGIRKLCLCRYIVARPKGKKRERSFSTTVLIPCRNERDNIEAAIERLPPFGEHQEIIFVDGHSTDGTQGEIERVIQAKPEKDIKWMVQDGTGKGDAVRKGFAAAAGDILMILDADLTVPPEDLPKFYRALAEDHGEFINGCRLVYPMEKQAMRFLNLLGNKFFSLTFSWLLNQRLKDTLCGTKVLLKKDYERIAANRRYFGDFDPFGDFDLLFGAAKLNLKIVEVPIRYHERTYGTTNIKRFRHGWLLLKMTLFAYRKIKAV